MKFILAVLAFVVAATAQDAPPAYQYFDNECTITQPDGTLNDLVGFWRIYNFTDNINCSTITYTEQNGNYNAKYGSLSDALQGEYGSEAQFVENPNRPGETEVFVNGAIVAIQVLIVVKPGVGYKSVVCDPRDGTTINLIGVYGEVNISVENLNKLVLERSDVAPQLKLKPVPLDC